MTGPMRPEQLSHEESRERYPVRELVRGFEGGAVYSAQRMAEFVLITVESTMSEFLDEEDMYLAQQGETVRVFVNADHRAEYAASRGWTSRH